MSWKDALGFLSGTAVMAGAMAEALESVNPATPLREKGQVITTLCQVVLT
ncbi:Glycyl-tRNA synthetase alpha chain [Altererythrobacter epoxidivorans]|uniref:Glycyl-tRNA synthetase alpha chain n=1 Tax=Altererythrobacter epoxidivorans TaxID=361183 RepID=A0A0M4M7H4_9SPHN|nr:Glycyl-tRNA synthetase alpha chain [Altererythrobacter epoxidivorans]